MKKLFLLVLLLLIFFVISCNKEKENNSSMNPNNVFICTGKYSKRYHKERDCKGLYSCKGEIKEIDKESAEKENKSPCSYCY